LPYIPNTDHDREVMLRAIGVSSVDDLFSTVPPDLRMRGELDVPGPLSEAELVRHMRRLSSMNKTTDDVLSFLGGGVYDHIVPAVVRHVTGMPQFYTAYTPYQAEASQGTLQSIYEFQSLVCRLTGLEVANASMYDGASAAAEACLMAVGVTRRRKVLVARSANPAIRTVSSTYLKASDLEIVEVPLTREGVTDLAALEAALADAAVLVVQHPNFFGLLEPVEEIHSLCEAAGALLVASVDPLSLAVLKPPSEYGAAIAVGEGQSLGSPVGYGGPLLGFMATERKHVRRMPGRIVGETVDSDGRRGYVMTLQTREQHIRREKATSNICTNQGLVALGAAVHLSLLGKKGFRDLAVQVASKAHYAARVLSEVAGVELRFGGPFFREFVIDLPVAASRVKDDLRKARIWPGISCGCWYDGMEKSLLVSVSEKHTRADIDSFASGLEAVLAPGGDK
jgi:glycine dehydrogenase subunit 1